MEIIIYKDFSEYPGLRNCDLSENSGEEFYHKTLNEMFYKSMKEGRKLVINLDNTGGFASSFLDEAFGNLVYDYTLEKVEKYIEIISEEEPHWIEMLKKKTFLEWEERRKSNRAPKKTKEHSPWYRMNKNNIEKRVWI